MASTSASDLHPLFDLSSSAVQGGPSAVHFNTFTGSPLDRLHEVRKQPATLAALLASADSVFLPIFKRQPLICSDQAHKFHFGAFLPRHRLPPDSADFAEAVLLGRVGSTNCYALAVSSAAPYETVGTDEAKQHRKFQDLRKSLPLLSAEDAAVLALATSLESWHSSTKYCARCGCRTVLIEGGDKRQCSGGESKAQLESLKASGEPLPGQQLRSEATEQPIKDAQTSGPAPLPAPSKACGTSIYPRTDAVVIMCVESSDKSRILLGRKAVFPKGIYTCLAGFLGPAESVEEGVRRETLEESGIRVGEVRYFGSQPWPFGGQVMIGCHAVATSDEIQLRDHELEDAKWFGLQEVEAMIAASLDATSFTTSEATRIPPPLAIAHKLIASWYYSKTAKSSL